MMFVKIMVVIIVAPKRMPKKNRKRKNLKKKRLKPRRKRLVSFLINKNLISGTIFVLLLFFLLGFSWWDTLNLLKKGTIELKKFLLGTITIYMKFWNSIPVLLKEISKELIKKWLSCGTNNNYKNREKEGWEIICSYI